MDAPGRERLRKSGRGERLRITPTPFHGEALVAALAGALADVRDRLGLSRYAGKEQPVVRSAVNAGNPSVAVFPPAGG